MESRAGFVKHKQCRARASAGTFQRRPTAAGSAVIGFSETKCKTASEHCGMPGVEYGLNVAFVASSPETENEKPQHQSPLTTRFAGDTRAAEIQSLEAWDHHSRHMSARPQAKPRSALSAAVSVSGAPPAELVAPKATRSAAGLLGANEPAAISFSQSHPEVAQLSTGAASGSGTGTGTSKSYRRLAFQPPSSSSTSPGPLSGSPARGASASPSFQLSSSYLARGSFQPGFIPPSSFQSSSGLSFARRRPSVYRFYRAPRAGEPALVVFSGGSGFNSAAEEMGKRLTTRVTHVLPVSDDGGSTAEIVRVLGGPAVGDIRSRCLRLSDDSTDEGQAVKALLGHRLHPSNATEAKHEWADIVEGTHPLWKGIGAPYRDTIRAFLLHFNYEILREPSTLFNFCNGSVGNFFFAGARTFFKSMDAAIFLCEDRHDRGQPPRLFLIPDFLQMGEYPTFPLNLWSHLLLQRRTDLR